TADAVAPTDGVVRVSVTVKNTGERAGEDVVQLYGRDVHASVTRPVAQLLGYQRIALEPGQSVTVSFAVPTTRLSFTNRDLVRVVEPGDVELWVGDAETRGLETKVELVGSVYEVPGDAPRVTAATVA